MAKIPSMASVDLLIADYLIDYQKDGEIEKYIKTLKAKYPDDGHKIIINKDEFDTLAPMLEHRYTGNCRGGTTSTTMATLGLLDEEKDGRKTEHHLMGIMGKDAYSKIVEGSFKGSGVKIHRLAEEVTSFRKNGVDKPEDPETAVSFVLRYPDKPPVIVTYPGNAKELVKTEKLPLDVIKQAKVLYLQGSLRGGKKDPDAGRFDPRVWDYLLELRKKNNQQLVLALPDTGFKVDYDWKWLSESANVVVSNIEQLQAQFGGTGEESVRRLQAHMPACNDVLRGPEYRQPEQVAFIMNGDKGAWAVKADQYEYVEAIPLEVNRVPHPLGVEDTAYAGFLAGHFAGMGLKESAKLAMCLAAAKQTDKWTSLKDPRATLSKMKAGSPMLEKLDKCRRASNEVNVSRPSSYEELAHTSGVTYSEYFLP